jgi:hypothetical protein
MIRKPLNTFSKINRFQLFFLSTLYNCLNLQFSHTMHRSQLPNIKDDDLMWRTQEINMTICQPLYNQMNECQTGGTPLTAQQCKDISVLYNGCLLSALDRKTKACIDVAQNNPQIETQRNLIDHVTKCLTSDGIRQQNESLSTRLNQMLNRNPMRDVLYKYRSLNNRVAQANRQQYNAGDNSETVVKKVEEALGDKCKEQNAALQKCVSDLEKNGHDEFTPMCFKEIVQRNFCLSSVVCAEQMRNCASYVDRQKRIHQVKIYFLLFTNDRLNMILMM